MLLEGNVRTHLVDLLQSLDGQQKAAGEVADGQGANNNAGRPT